MKQRRRLGIIFGGLSIVILVAGWLTLHSLSLSGDECRVAAFRAFKPTGSILKVVGLSSDQRIEITRIRAGHREDKACTFIITGGTSGRLVAIQRSIAYQKDWGVIAGDFGGSAFREITADQQRGLDTLIRFIKLKQDPDAHYYDTYEIEHFSGDQKIGSEKWVDFVRMDCFYQGCPYDELPIEMRALVTVDDWKALQSVNALLNEIEGQARQTLK